MRIGIQISSDIKQRTGIEEYIFQILKNLPLVDDYKNHQFFIYTRETLKWPFKCGWTQLRMSWEMKKNPPDVLFVPAHTFPLIHPRLVITIQGLEFERMPKMYSFWKRMFLKWITKRNIKKAEKIIVPSQNTKDDLIKFYPAIFKKSGASNKIFVVYHGVDNPACNASKLACVADRYILYLGRGDQRKNINGLIKAFGILKHERLILHKLILAGPNIGYKIPKDLKNDIICTGYVDNDRKWDLLKNAGVFVFPSFYEGFGIPVLEAQKIGAPVVASNTSSMPEILGDSALLINPYHPHDIAEGIYKIISNPQFKAELIRRGYENVKKFSWRKCTEETFKTICA